jgi:hypothetical protein
LLADSILSDYSSPDEVAHDIPNLNAYPNINQLSTPTTIKILEDFEGLSEIGRKAVLKGLIFLEHPAACEATRLGLGPKFF